MKFFTRAPFEGRNLADQQISIPRYTYVEAPDKYVLWNNIPFCFPTSQIARDYLIWADDGNEKARGFYEDIILFTPRARVWTEDMPRYDEEGHIIGYVKVRREGRFSPEEVKYILLNFPQFFDTPDTMIFNNYFYLQSNIVEVRNLADYLNREN